MRDLYDSFQQLFPGRWVPPAEGGEATGERGHLLLSQHRCACYDGSLQPKQTSPAQNGAPVQRCYCAINMPLLWYRRLSVTTALVELVKSDNALAWPETAYKVFLYTPCKRSGNMLICYSQRQNSQVRGRNQSLVICTRLPKGKWQVSG